MPTLDLPSALRAQLEGVLARVTPDLEVWAYGSRVEGSSRPASDLDLVLRDAVNPEHPTGQVSALRAALRESDLPILVDIHDWASLPPTFRAEIQRAYVVLQDLSSK
jgi:uncharacterized protein